MILTKIQLFVVLQKLQLLWNCRLFSLFKNNNHLCCKMGKYHKSLCFSLKIQNVYISFFFAKFTTLVKLHMLGQILCSTVKWQISQYSKFFCFFLFFYKRIPNFFPTFVELHVFVIKITNLRCKIVSLEAIFISWGEFSDVSN